MKDNCKIGASDDRWLDILLLVERCDTISRQADQVLPTLPFKGCLLVSESLVWMRQAIAPVLRIMELVNGELSYSTNANDLIESHLVGDCGISAFSRFSMLMKLAEKSGGPVKRSTIEELEARYERIAHSVRESWDVSAIEKMLDDERDDGCVFIHKDFDRPVDKVSIRTFRNDAGIKKVALNVTIDDETLTFEEPSRKVLAHLGLFPKQGAQTFILACASMRKKTLLDE